MDDFEGMGLVFNFSKNGMFISIPEVVPTHREIAVIVGETDHTYSIRGEVVWTRKSLSRLPEESQVGVGIRIKDADQRYLRFVEDLLAPGLGVESPHL